MELFEAPKLSDDPNIVSQHNALSGHYNFEPSQARPLRKLTKDSRDLNRHLHQQYTRNKIVDIGRTKELDSVLAAHKAPHSFVVYSGLVVPVKPGIYHHAGYLHTSLDFNIAKNFVKFIREPEINLVSDCYILRITVPQGSPGAYVGHMTNQQKAKKLMNTDGSDPTDRNEHEFILPRNTRLKILPNPETTVQHERADLGDDEYDDLYTNWHIFSAEIV